MLCLSVGETQRDQSSPSSKQARSCKYGFKKKEDYSNLKAGQNKTTELAAHPNSK